MGLSGGCHCGQLRYQIDGEIAMRGLCLCTTCQKISGGAGNLFIGINAAAFSYTAGAPSVFASSDLSPRREFCGTCGVHIAARSPKAPTGLIVKVGTLDQPSHFRGAGVVSWASEKQPYHLVPEGVPVFDSIPSSPLGGSGMA